MHPSSRAVNSGSGNRPLRKQTAKRRRSIDTVDAHNLPPALLFTVTVTYTLTFAGFHAPVSKRSVYVTVNSKAGGRLCASTVSIDRRRFAACLQRIAIKQGKQGLGDGEAQCDDTTS